MKVRFHQIKKISQSRFFIPSVMVFLISVAVFIGGIKFFSNKTRTIYVDVKLSQGIWWVNTAKPSIWAAKAVRKGAIERNGMGEPIAEVLEVRSYSWRDSDLYDVYVKLKIRATYNPRTEKFNYKRADVAVGAPIDLDFTQFQLTGTIINFSPSPLAENLIEKEVVFFKSFSTNKDYQELEIGDRYNDGVEDVLTITDIKVDNTYALYNPQGNNYPIETSIPKNVTITAKIKLKEDNGSYIYGKEKILKIGKFFDASLNDFSFADYKIVSIL